MEAWRNVSATRELDPKQSECPLDFPGGSRVLSATRGGRIMAHLRKVLICVLVVSVAFVGLASTASAQSCGFDDIFTNVFNNFRNSLLPDFSSDFGSSLFGNIFGGFLSGIMNFVAFIVVLSLSPLLFIFAPFSLIGCSLDLNGSDGEGIG
jgi:hypothetical protein